MVAKTVEIFEPYYNPYDISERDIIVLSENSYTVYHRLFESKWCILVGNMGKIRMGDSLINNTDVKGYTKMALDSGDRVFVAQETLFYDVPKNFINISAKSLNAHKTVARKPVCKTAVRKTTKRA